MTKVFSSILSGPIGLIDRKLGQTISGIGLTAIGVVTGNPLLISAGTFQLGQAFAPQAPKPEQTETALKSPTPPRVSGYGTQRIAMAFGLYVTAPDGTAIDVGAFHDGRIDAIIGYYLGDIRIVVLPDGRVQAGKDGQFGELSDIVKVYTRLGERTETAFAEVIAKVPDQWTVNHRGDGQVTAAVLSAPVKTKNYQMIYPTGGPNQMPLSLVMRLQLVYDWRDPAQVLTDPTTWKWSENAWLHIAHYELIRAGARPRLPLTDPGYPAELAALLQAKWDRKIAPTLAYWTAAADDADVPMPLKGVQTVLVEDANDGSGHVTLNGTNGLTIGATIYLSATGNTSLSETRTVTSIAENNGGYVVGLNTPLANDHPAGSQVTYDGSGATEPRYRSCVVHKHTDAHKSVRAALLACCDGWMAPRADRALAVYSGRYVAPDPADEIGPDDILSYSLQLGVEEESAVNQLSVTYVSANHDYNTVDTDAWEDEDDIARRGKVLADQLANQVPSHSQGRRLAKRKLAEINAPERGTTLIRADARDRVLGKRYIPLWLHDAGTTFLRKVVQVQKLTRNMTTGAISIEWISADPNVDAWNPATEEGEPAPVGNVVAASPLATPTVISAMPVYSAVGQNPDTDTPLGGTESGGVSTGARVLIVANGPIRDDLTWNARWRVGTSGSWSEREYPDADPGPGVSMTTEFVPLVTNLNVEVAYETGTGVLSPWSEPTVVDTTQS